MSGINYLFKPRLGGELKISNFIICSYRIVLERNYFSHAESPRNYLFQKYFSSFSKIEDGGPLRG